MTDKQHDLDLGGSETNIKGNVSAPVLSGKFNAPVTIIGTASMLIPHQIPQAPPDFTGRDDELDELLTHFDSGVTVIGLRGMGGVGKTALAFKLAEKLRDRYPDGQLMVELNGTGENPMKPSEAMAKVIHSYDSAVCLPDNDAAIGNLYRTFLDGRRSLLLLDNAADDQQVRPLLPLPKACGVILTSRLVFTLPGLKKIDLNILKPENAVELLLKVHGSDLASAIFLQHKETWNEIARLCGHLPLALRAAGSFLAITRDLSPEGYVKLLREERTRLESIGEKGVDMGVEASLNLSYSRLPPETARIFCMFSVFPAGFDSQAEEFVCQDKDHENLSELLRWNLVEYRVETERYHLHDLVRIFATKKRKEEDEAKAILEAQQRHASYYGNVFCFANHQLTLGKEIQDGLRLFDRESSNILSGEAWIGTNIQANDSLAEICRTYYDSGNNILDLRLHPKKRILWLKNAVVASRQLKDDRMEGASLGRLGQAYFALSEVRKSIEQYELALAIARHINDRQGEGAALGNLGNAYSHLGEMYKAIGYYEQALDISRQINDRRNEEAWLGDLGMAYYSLGDVAKAIEYCEQALYISRQIGDRRNEGFWLGNLGISYNALGKVRSAIEHLDKCLSISREIDDKESEGSALGNLGNCCSHLGDIQKAIEHYENALETFRETGNKRAEGIQLANLGLAQFDLGETRKAIEYYQRALEISKITGNREGEGDQLSNLGMAYLNLGELLKAFEYQEMALNIAQKIGNKRVEGAIMSKLGLIYDAMGEIGKATEHFRQAIEISLQVKDKLGEAVNLGNIGIIFDRMGQREKAIECTKAAQSIFEQIESPNADIAKKKLAEWQSQK
jgi:tetratricopeptide (TPR) repeat protein